MRRLYSQIYLTVLAVLLLMPLLLGAVWYFGPERDSQRRLQEEIIDLAEELLPPDSSTEELHRTLERWHRKFGPDLALFASDGELIASAGASMPAPRLRQRQRPGWRRWGPRHIHTVELSDGRWLQARSLPREGTAWRLIGFLALLAVAVGLASHPIVRRLTRRLENLKGQLDRLGEGDLTTRVDVEGNDEVAGLATSFNRSAARIEELVQNQRDLLASVSHELRSPLTRLQLAVELLGGDTRPDLRDRISKEIKELDGLIDELLLASRLQAGAVEQPRERLDLLGLLAEESARVAGRVEGSPCSIVGDERMLRRMFRNLLENAVRHAPGSPPEVSLTQDSEVIRIQIADRGPGIPEADRARIFEPFYRSSESGSNSDGVGMGLAIVVQIAKHHGGSVAVQPRPGDGSIFEVTLARHA